MAELDDDELELNDDEEQRKRQQAIGAPFTGPKAPVAFDEAPISSTLTPPASQAIGKPLDLAPAAAPRPNYEAYETQLNNKAGVDKIGGFKGGMLRTAEAIGSAFNPQAMSYIPGTHPHHQAEIGRARTAAEEENRQIASRTEEQFKGAQTEEQQALAKKNANPPAKVGQTPEETTIHDLMTGNNGTPRVNPKTQQPYTYMDAFTDVMAAKQGVKPQPKPDAPEQQYIDEYQKKHPGSSVQDAIKQYHKDTEKEPTGSWMPLYDDKGNVTGAWNATTGEHRSSTPGAGSGRTAAGSHIATAADAANEKKVAPYKAIVEEADKAATLKDMADKGNAEADVDLALTFFKTMRSATSGGSGIRFTQQENNLIMGARSLLGGLEVKGNRIFSNGEPLSREQRQQILDVINVHRQAAQRHIDEATKGAAPDAGGGNIQQHPSGVSIIRDANGRITGVQ